MFYVQLEEKTRVNKIVISNTLRGFFFPGQRGQFI